MPWRRCRVVGLRARPIGVTAGVRTGQAAGGQVRLHRVVEEGHLGLVVGVGPDEGLDLALDVDQGGPDFHDLHPWRSASCAAPLSGGSLTPALFRAVRRGPPLAAEDELGQRSARSQREVAAPEVVGQRAWVGGVPDGQPGQRPDAVRDAVQLAGLGGVSGRFIEAVPRPPVAARELRASCGGVLP
jgi:hypothetical protein